MDERTPRLEAHFEHLQSDVTEVKAGMRYVEAKVDRLNEKLDSRTDAVRDSIAALSDRLDRKLAWIVGLILTLAAGGAGGFLWLANQIAH